MKIYNDIHMLFIMFVMLILIGCVPKEDPLKPNSMQTVVVEKKVIVKCEIPKVECEFKGDGFVPTVKLLECIALQKEAIRICTEATPEEELKE